ncbi:MAG: lipopolysaccharide biosynthesis protein [Micavibrio sp.]
MGRNAIWSILNQSVGQFLVLAVFLVTARFVSKEDFGVIAVCLLIVEFIRHIIAESVVTTLLAKREPGARDYNAAFWAVLAGHSIAALCVLASAGPVADFMKDARIEDTLRFLSVLIVTLGLSKIHEAWLAKNYQFKKLALRSLLSILAGGAAGIWLALGGHGLVALIVQQIVTAVVSTLWLWCATPWKPGFETGRENFAPLLSYARHVSAASIIRFCDGHIDILMASFYLGPAATGAYNAGKRIVTAIALMFNAGLNAVALPVMAGRAGEAARTAQGFLKWMKYSTLTTAPIYAGFIVMAPELIDALLGDKWAEVAPVAAILAATTLVSALSQIKMNIFLTQGKPHWQTAMMLIACVLNILFLLVFVRYGLNAMAWALFLRAALLYPFLSWLTLRELRIGTRAYAGAIAAPLFSALLMAVSIWLFKHYGLHGFGAWTRIALCVPAGMALYGYLIGALDRKSARELYQIAGETLFRRKERLPPIDLKKKQGG